jgi:hypothetical protein
VGALAASPACQASQILYQRSILFDRSVNIFETNRFDLDVILGDSFFSSAPENSVTLFDDVVITPADAGRVFESNATNEPRFAAAADRLSNAIDEYVRVKFMEQASGRADQQGWSESGFFTGLSEPGKPDLSGLQITAIELKIDHFGLVFGPVPPAGTAGSAPPVQMIATLTILGAVPEPTALTLGLAAVCGIAYATRNGRR